MSGNTQTFDEYYGDDQGLLDFTEEDLSLPKLQLLIEYVFFPMLNHDRMKSFKMSLGEPEILSSSTESTVGNFTPATQTAIIPPGTLNLDFVNNFKKFNQHISYMIHQLSGDVTIDIPDVSIHDLKAAAEDEQVCSIFLNCCLEKRFSNLVNCIVRL